MKTLAKEFGSLSVTKAGPAWSITTNETAEGWEQMTPLQPSFVNRTYFDLAGMAMDDLTLFFTGATTQNAYPPSTIPAGPGNRAYIWDIMTNKPLTNEELGLIVTRGNTSGSGLTFDQTIYMRIRVLNTDLDNQASGAMIPIFDEQMGSLNPTASDRVYCSRMVVFSGADGNYFTYPVRYILQANAKEEPEYEYLMRLKRSYELQNEPDRD
jgi:hypothetical protein